VNSADSASTAITIHARGLKKFFGIDKHLSVEDRGAEDHGAKDRGGERVRLITENKKLYSNYQL